VLKHLKKGKTVCLSTCTCVFILKGVFYHLVNLINFATRDSVCSASVSLLIVEIDFKNLGLDKSVTLLHLLLPVCYFMPF